MYKKVKTHDLVIAEEEIAKREAELIIAEEEKADRDPWQPCGYYNW